MDVLGFWAATIQVSSWICMEIGGGGVVLQLVSKHLEVLFLCKHAQIWGLFNYEYLQTGGFICLQILQTLNMPKSW